MTEIKAVVEPIVDSLTNLIIECVNGSMKDVTTHCMTLAKGTESLVGISQNVALSSDDNDLTNEIINSINFISDKIEALVLAFTTLIQNRGDPEVVSKFSIAAQNVADAINNLVIVTDETSQKRLTALIRKAVQSNRALDSTLDTKNKHDLLVNADAFLKIHSKLVDVTLKASASTQIQRKRELLKRGSDEVRETYPILESSIKQYYTTNDQAAFTAYDSACKRIAEAYKYIIEACKIDEESNFAKLREIVDAIMNLIRYAKEIHQSSGDLIISISKDAPLPERMKLADRVESQCKPFIDNARIIANNVSDPTIKKVIEASVEDLESSLNDILKIARSNNVSPADKNKAANAYEKLMNSVQKIVTSSRRDAIESFPVHLTSEALSNAVEKLFESAKKGDVEGTSKKAIEVIDLATQLANILTDKANKTDDPNERKYLLEAADAIRKAISDVVTNAKVLAQNPNSVEALNNFNNSRAMLRKAIDRARGVEGTPDGFLTLPQFDDLETKSEQPQPRQQFNFDFEELDTDDELIKASKAQARAALDVVKEAEKYLSELADDPAKQAKIREVSDKVRELAANVVNSARKAAENPDDPKAQAEMAKYQNELASAIGELLSLIGKGTDKNVANALKDLEDVVSSNSGQSSDQDSGDASLANNFFAIASEISNLIKTNFENNVSNDVQKDVEIARAIATLSTKANKALQELSKTVKAETFKSQIINSGKIISDNALKLKILSAVKVSGGDDSTGQVSSAAIGLKKQTEDIVSQLKAGFLRHRVQSTAKQALALKKIAEAVRKARYY